MDALNLAEHAGHGSHVTALSVFVKCADIPGHVESVPHQGLGTLTQDKNSPARNGRTQSRKRQISFYPQDSPLSVFWQSDYVQILPQEGEEGAHRADPAAEPLPEFFSTKSPVQTLRGVRVVGGPQWASLHVWNHLSFPSILRVTGRKPPGAAASSRALIVTPMA